MVSKYARGSEWRKWDLHVHTPASILSNQFGDNWDNYVKTLFSTAIEKEIACIGITDYFSIDGYKKIKTEYIDCDEKLNSLFADKLLTDPTYIEKIRSILLLPNVEFRLENVITIENHDFNKNTKLEYHLILSDELSIQQIEENILSQLCFASSCSVQLGIDHAPLTRSNLEKLGAKLKNIQTEFIGKSDYYIGCMCAAINFQDLSGTIKKMKNELMNKYLFVLVEDDITRINWADQGHQIRKNIYANSHMIFSSNPKTIKWGLEDSTKEEFTTYKGCIWGSDAHNYQKLLVPEKNRYCWIKADPTFAGLLQVAIQPHDRVYIGNTSPALDIINKNKSKYIKELRINKKDSAKNAEVWFDAQLPINPGLVAIIGNKGSGKSALSDILGFLCHCKSMDSASFLHKDRFQREDKKYADDYQGTITWADEHIISEDSLYSVSDNTILEYAKYLPQKYIETVCGNLGDEFQNEINHVIFSYIDKSERGDATNLAELIERKCVQLYADIRTEQQKLEAINKKIIMLEDKAAPNYTKECQSKLNHYKEELERLKANKPVEVSDPSKNEDAENAKRILEIDKQLLNIENQISNTTGMLNEVIEKLDEVSNIISNINSIETTISELNKRYIIFAKKNGLSEEKQLIGITISSDSLLAFKNDLEDKKREYSKLLKPPSTQILWDDESYLMELQSQYSDSLLFLKEKLLHEKGLLISQTSAEQQLYQKYKDDLKEWQDRQNSIIGDSQTEDTITYYETALKYVQENLKDDLLALDNQRITCMQSIFNSYKQVALILTGLYEPVKQKLSNILCNVEDTIDFSADIVARKSLSNDIVQKINKRAKGTFRGITETTAFIDELIRSTNFNDFDSFKSFFDKIIAAIREDYDQIPKIIPDRNDFYQYLSEMRYISVEYTLKLGDKTMLELSPGERGMVLLVFYLALSKDNLPLIIDQPEDNLDNQSVYNKLVPCIMEAKKNRQVIIVTHNPNIAVACDAEQIIYCKIDKSKTQISYMTGSIENPDIRAKVIDVLEGTEPAFDLRKSKYFFDFLHVTTST